MTRRMPAVDRATVASRFAEQAVFGQQSCQRQASCRAARATISVDAGGLASAREAPRR